MAKSYLPTKLIDDPAFMADNWKGYYHFQDPTTLPFNVLTYPSYNCTMPSFDKIVPDYGRTLLGQEYTENAGIVGNKEKFKNLGGIEMEVRAFVSTDANLKDVIQVGFFNGRLVFNTLVGAFTVGEIVSGGTSGASGKIVSIVGTVLFLTDVVGTFAIGETITGLTSGATANTVLVPEYTFHQITENVNPLPRGVHEYYFDEWFDTSIDESVSKNLPRLIWVNGYTDGAIPAKGAIYSWTGGLVTVTSLTASTLTIETGTSWRSYGFTEDALGNAYVVVNGVKYTLVDPTDLDTDTIDVTDTTGVSIGDTATSLIETDIAPIPFDMCRNNKGYMFYGNWKQRDLYQSNAFNRPSAMSITNVQAVQNDLVLSGTYTGTGQHVYRITVDSVNPDINTQTYTGTGADDGGFDTTGYTGTGKNVYRVSVVANFGIVFNLTPTGWEIGEIIVGGTSGATAIIFTPDAGGSDIWVNVLGDIPFQAGEVVTGQSSGTTGTINNCHYQVVVQCFKNEVEFTPVGFTTFLGYQFLAGTHELIDGIFFTSLTTDVGFSGDYWTTHVNGDYWELTISEAQPDTFQWQIDGAAPVATFVDMTGAVQSLSDGVDITFVSINGHTLGDFWEITVDQDITRAWANFYYSLPIRKPGEGYKYRLPSNFWTMDTQEESMYINGSFGEWGYVSTVLSSDLQSEDVSYTPLKQAGANKVLYPYLTSHINDKLIYINTERSLDTLGREQFLEKPQTGYLSDPVRLDFLASSFKGGRIKYFGKRLYVSSPEDGIMHTFDTFKGYWQPPKKFPEMGILSIVGNNLVAHSNVRNQSFTMFTNSGSDNGQAYEVSIRTPYTALGDRWGTKWSNMSFTEGYIQGNPKLQHTVYLGVEGCGGVYEHEIQPIVCVIPDRAPFGEGSFGSHPNGSDIGIEGAYFQEIYKAYSPVMEWYFLSVGLKCTAKAHTYSILSFGMNAMEGQTGNNALVNRNNLAISN